jgi:hypothetical protein
MRSVKLLVAMAVVAAFVAGPVLAQDATGGGAPATAGTDTMKPAPKHHAKKHSGKHHKKSSSTTTAPAPASTPAQ